MIEPLPKLFSPHLLHLRADYLASLCNRAFPLPDSLTVELAPHEGTDKDGPCYLDEDDA